MHTLNRNTSQWMMMQMIEKQSEESSEDSLEKLIYETNDYIKQTKSEFETQRLIEQEDMNSLKNDLKKLETSREKAESASRELKRDTKTMIIGGATALITAPIAPLAGLAAAGIGMVGAAIAAGVFGAGSIVSGYFTYKRAEGDECIKLIQKSFPEFDFIHAERLYKEVVTMIMNKHAEGKTVSYREGPHIKYNTFKILEDGIKSTKHVLKQYKIFKDSGMHQNMGILLQRMEAWAAGE